ncbi:MAG: hypothetical protein ACYCZF_17185 [Anaerolineae bacterium]
MRLGKLANEFVTIFIVSLVIAALVTFLWNLIGHGIAAVDWETSFRFAMILGTILTWIKSRDTLRK